MNDQMVIEIERDVLARMAGVAAKLVGDRVAMPILSAVILESDGNGLLTMHATNLQTFLTQRLEGIGGKGEGSWAVGARLFAQLVSGLPEGKVTITENDGLLHVQGATVGRKTKGSSFDLTTYPVKDFPEMPTLEGTATCTVDGKMLVTALKRVTVATATDEKRGISCATHFEIADGKLTLVATDTYHLHVAEGIEVSCGDSVTAEANVPVAALNLIPDDAETVGVTLADFQIRFDAGDVTIVSRLLEGEYHPWRRAFPESTPHRLTAARKALIKDLEQIAVLAKANTPAKFWLDDEIRITGRQTGTGLIEQIPEATWEGDRMVMGLNPSLTVQALKVLDGDEIHMDVFNPGRAALLTSESTQGFTAVIMPIKIHEND